MILDSSALVAILFKETDASLYLRALLAVDTCRISTGTYLESAMVVEREAKPGAGGRFETFLRSASVIIEPFTIEQARIARQAFLDFGKGRHPAGLNFGDCFAYALAKAMREPLLFKGEDFRKTDLVPAL